MAASAYPAKERRQGELAAGGDRADPGSGADRVVGGRAKDRPLRAKGAANPKQAFAAIHAAGGQRDLAEVGDRRALRRLEGVVGLSLRSLVGGQRLFVGLTQVCDVGGVLADQFRGVETGLSAGLDRGIARGSKRAFGLVRKSGRQEPCRAAGL